MKYEICYDAMPDKLAQKVCDLIDQGWMPVGGVAIGINEYERDVADTYDERTIRTQLFAQAMVLPDEQPQQRNERRILTGAFQS